MCRKERAETWSVGAQDASCEFDFAGFCVRMRSRSLEEVGERRDSRPNYDALKCVCDIIVADADPGDDTEEAHQTDDTRTIAIESVRSNDSNLDSSKR